MLNWRWSNHMRPRHTRVQTKKRPTRLEAHDDRRLGPSYPVSKLHDVHVDLLRWFHRHLHYWEKANYTKCNINKVYTLYSVGCKHGGRKGYIGYYRPTSNSEDIEIIAFTSTKSTLCTRLNNGVFVNGTDWIQLQHVAYSLHTSIMLDAAGIVESINRCRKSPHHWVTILTYPIKSDRDDALAWGKFCVEVAYICQTTKWSGNPIVVTYHYTMTYQACKMFSS